MAKKQHPSIVEFVPLITPPAPASYPLGQGLGVLPPAGLGVLLGGAATGRTTTAAHAAAATVAALAGTGRTLLWAAVDDTAEQGLAALERAGIGDRVLRKHVRVAHTPTLEDLKTFVAAELVEYAPPSLQVGPALVVIDDAGALTSGGSRADQGLLELTRQLRSGAFDGIVQRESGWGRNRLASALGLPGRRLAVLATLRTRSQVAGPAGRAPHGPLAAAADVLAQCHPASGAGTVPRLQRLRLDAARR